MTRKSFHIWLLIGELWLVLAGLYARSPGEVIEFVQSGCPPCQKMEPIVVRLRAAGYQIEAINLSYQRDARSGGFGTPQFVALDTEGVVVARLVGSQSYEALEAFVRRHAARNHIEPRAPPTERTSCPGGTCPMPQWQPRQQAQQQIDWHYAQPPESVCRVWCQVGAERSGGSGTLVAPDIVITAAHVVAGGGQISVTFPGGEPIRATLIASDSADDLAALRLAQGVRIEPTTLAEHYPRVGDAVTSAGYGPDGRYAINTGRAMGYFQARDQRSNYTLEISGAARQGDSGGPMLNSRGELVGVLFGTDGRIVDGTVCTRIRKFLARLLPHRQSEAAPTAPATPGPVDDSPPTDRQGCQCGPDCDCKAAELAALNRELAAATADLQDARTAHSGEQAAHKSALDRLKDKLREAENKPAEIKHVPGPVKEVIVEKIAPAAEAWFGTKAIALAAGFGVPGWAAAIGIWIAKRRIGKRLKQWEGGDLSSAASGLQVERDGLVATVKALREQIHRLTTDRANPVVITRDNPIPPQLVAENREYVPVEVPQLEYEALQWAIDDYIKRNPTHRALFEQIDAVAKQYVSGRRNRRAAKVQ